MEDRRRAVVTLAGVLCLVIFLCGSIDGPKPRPEALEELPSCRKWVNYRCVDREASSAHGNQFSSRQALFGAAVGVPGMDGGKGQAYEASLKRLVGKYDGILSQNQRLEALLNSREKQQQQQQQQQLAAAAAALEVEPVHQRPVVPAITQQAAVVTRGSGDVAGGSDDAVEAVKEFANSIAPAVGRLWLAAQALKQQTSAVNRRVAGDSGMMLADADSVDDLRKLGLEGAARLTGVQPRGPGQGLDNQFTGGFPSEEMETLSAGGQGDDIDEGNATGANATNATASKPEVCWFWCGKVDIHSSTEPFWASDLPQNATPPVRRQAVLRGTGGQAGGDSGYLDEFGGAAERLRGAKAARVALDGAHGDADGVRKRVDAFMRAFGDGGGEPGGSAESDAAARGGGVAGDVKKPLKEGHSVGDGMGVVKPVHLSSVDEPGIVPRCGWPMAPCHASDGYSRATDQDSRRSWDVPPPQGDETDAFSAVGRATGRGLDAELQQPLQFESKRQEKDNEDERMPLL